MDSDDDSKDHNKNAFDMEDEDEVHIRVIQRKGRKYMTTVSGIAKIFDFKKILRYWKKMMNCNGSIDPDEHNPQKLIIQVSGDHREKIKEFLLAEGIVLAKPNIKVHGA